MAARLALAHFTRSAEAWPRLLLDASDVCGALRCQVVGRAHERQHAGLPHRLLPVAKKVVVALLALPRIVVVA